MYVGMQDINKTNDSINKNSADLSKMSTGEICEMFEVDGILSSQFVISEPVPTFITYLSLFLTIMEDGLFSLNNNDLKEVSMNLSLRDCETTSLLWNYTDDQSGGILDSYSNLVSSLMVRASKNIPYYIK